MKTTTVEINCDFCNKIIDDNNVILAKRVNIQYKTHKVMLNVSTTGYMDICIDCVNDAIKQYCKELG